MHLPGTIVCVAARRAASAGSANAATGVGTGPRLSLFGGDVIRDDTRLIDRSIYHLYVKVVHGQI